jgi:hypothetical protein
VRDSGTLKRLAVSAHYYREEREDILIPGDQVAPGEERRIHTKISSKQVQDKWRMSFAYLLAVARKPKTT